MLKWHNFGRWELFRELVDIAIADNDVFFVFALHGSSSLTRGQHAIFRPILQ